MSQTYTWPAVVSSAPPVGGATAANQVLEIAALNSIDSKLTNPVPVTGPLTNTQLRATDVSVLITNGSVPVRGNGVTGTAVTGNTLLISGENAGTQRNLAVSATGHALVDISSAVLPTGAATEATLAAFSNKSAGALVPEAFDYQDITYVGASTDVDQVIYKSGGAGGTVVATLTMGYDGSNRLSSVTKT